MVNPESSSSVDDINLNSWRFWTAPTLEREACFELLRRERPVSFHPVPQNAKGQMGPAFWAVTRHANVLDVSRNPELWSSASGVTIRDFPPGLAPYFRSMVNMDDPDHSRLRRIVSRGFTPAALAKLERDVLRQAAKIVDDVVGKGECDFVNEIAAPLPLLVICDMMGIPESESGRVFDHTNVVVGAADPDYFPKDSDPMQIQISAVEALADLMKELASERLREPQNDLISQLVHADIEGEELSAQELASFFVLLVTAGNETTRTAISQGMKALCDHPEQRQRWSANFEGLAQTGVEEILRWTTPVLHMRRTATRDAEVGGQLIREGERVVLWYNSANRDALVFDEPHIFDISRSPNEHVAFGGLGAHYCLGASLARKEITAMFREVLRRLPDLELSAEPEMLRSNFTNGIKRMPCKFTPDGSAY